MKNFIENSPNQENIKFSTNAYIRAKLHDYCDEVGKDRLSHESITKKGSRVLIIKKLDFNPPVPVKTTEPEVNEITNDNKTKPSKFSLTNLVQQIYDQNEPEKTSENTTSSPEIPENHTICSFCGKPIPTENLPLHQVHCERMQLRRAEMKKSEQERLQAHKSQNKINSTSKKSAGLQKKPKNSHKLGTGKNKPKDNQENIDDLMNFINEEGAEKPKVNHLEFLKNINNSGGHTTVQSRSKKIKQAQLKNKLNNKLSDMEKDRKGNKNTKKK